jgi:energy-coupling factor transporter ATP-binding protein EcfA2
MIAEDSVHEAMYIQLHQHVSVLLDGVAGNSDDPALAGAQAQAREKLSAIKETIIRSIEELRRNAEHKTFTIAFYGETNAGKSTLIETLRILLNEKSKQAQRERFIALQQELELNDEAFQALEAEIETLAEQHAQVQRDIIQAAARYDERQKQQANQEAFQAEKLKEVKARTSLFRRLLSFFYKSPEKIALLKLQAGAAVLLADREAELRLLQDLREGIEKKQSAALQHQKNRLNNLHLLEPYADGSIIGDGRPDFTRQTQIYEFDLDGQAFKLLDVPGIEGDENKVSEQINNAVKRAHAVFYVTSKAAPPQTADAGHQGTLEKIKGQLGDQTEVWTIYNKRITNPLGLQRPALAGADEQAGLGSLDNIMSQHLGKHYRRSITLSALPAFYAVAACLIPRSMVANAQKKFLDVLTIEVLLEKSGVRQFFQHLVNDLMADVKIKIRRSNMNKVLQAFNRVCSDIKILETENFLPLAVRLEEEALSAKHQLGMAFEGLENKFYNTVEGCMGGFEGDVRGRIYSFIENDIDTDRFKESLSLVLKEEAGKLQAHLPKALDKQVLQFRKDINDIIQRFESRSAELFLGFSKINKFDVKKEFDIHLNIENGFDLEKVAESFFDAISSFLFGALKLEIYIKSIIFAINLLRGAISYFSTDFKKAQQRKAAEKSIKKASDDIRLMLLNLIKEIFHSLQGDVERIMLLLEQPAAQAKHTAQALNAAHLGLQELTRDITHRERF